MPTSAPPDVPAGTDPKLADYLRRLNAWAYQELQKKAPLNEAIPALHFLPSDQKPPQTTFMLQIDHTGAVRVMQMPLGGGTP